MLLGVLNLFACYFSICTSLIHLLFNWHLDLALGCLETVAPGTSEDGEAAGDGRGQHVLTAVGGLSRQLPLMEQKTLKGF